MSIVVISDTTQGLASFQTCLSLLREQIPDLLPPSGG